MRWILSLCFIISGCLTSNENEVDPMGVNANGINEWIFTQPGDIQFTVDTSLKSVNFGLVPATATFKTNAGTQFFQAGEQVLINEVIVIFPTQFCQGDLNTPINFTLEFISQTSGTFGNISELGDQGSIQIPLPNTIFVSPANIINEAVQNTELWALRIVAASGTVSMLNTANVTPAINGDTFDIIIGLNIRHNSPIS